ncbi:hypothetical protein LSH36_438g02036 [Paralvinella palmiformis]|uniref:Uncharacterized protein n=1 Tax=Paralvinella palmiformis TaxID=53620 RepID=A0AAD9JBX8_9ANNE|nr:hypothetical protein LSH36_438g02036 [Paralvinella palmiformis]
MAKHEVDISLGRTASRHFDDSLTFRISGVLAELEESKFDDAGVYVSDPVDGEKPHSTTFDGIVFGGWKTSPVDRQPNSRIEAAPASGKKHHMDASGESVNFVASNIQNARSYKHHSKLVDIDYFGGSVCKTCVEPTTYRYVVNNGRYRSSKALIQKFGVQKTSRRLTDARSLNPEQKRLQKEIQRELRREFGLADERNQIEDREQNKTFIGLTGETSSHKTVPDVQRKDEVVQLSRNEVDDPDKRVGEDVPGEVGKHSSPLILPAIAVPLVKTDSRPNGVDISCIASQLDVFREVAGKNVVAGESRRTRRGIYLGTRSRSEPPPLPTPSSGARMPSGTERNGAVNFEVVPTTLRRDVTSLSSSALRNHNSGTRPQKECPPGDTICMNKRSNGWAPNESTCESLDLTPTSAAQFDDVQAATVGEKRKLSDRAGTHKNSSSDGSDSIAQDSVPLTQIRYMAASGEVSNVPKFGKSSEEIPTADLYSSVELERDAVHPKAVSNRMNTYLDIKTTGDKIQTGMTTKFRTSLPNKNLSKDIPSHQHKSHVVKNSHLFSNLDSGKLMGGGFRAFPVGQMKIVEKNQLEHQRTDDLDILPKISGRKVTMAVTSHRIV